MAIWPFEQLIEVINGKRAMRVTQTGSIATVKKIADNLEVPADSIAIIEDEEYLECRYISVNGKANGEHDWRVDYREQIESGSTGSSGSLFEETVNNNDKLFSSQNYELIQTKYRAVISNNDTENAHTYNIWEVQRR